MSSHIIQISIDMDTDRIKKIVEEQAARQIIKDIQDKIEVEMFDHSGWRSEATDPNHRIGFSDYILRKFSEFIDENKESIVQYAGDKIVEKTFRSKAYKETIEKLNK